MDKLNFLMVVCILFVFAFAGNVQAANTTNIDNSTNNLTVNATSNNSAYNSNNISQNTSANQSITEIYYCDTDKDGFISNKPFNLNETNCTKENNSVILLCDNTTINCSIKGGNDCNDSNSDIPGTIEICNGIDDNCNNLIDGEEKAKGCKNYYEDKDNDGYGSSYKCLCQPQNPHNVTTGGDCNDQNSSIYPNATEICNGIDDNCNNKTDEGNVCPLLLYYRDKDKDNFISIIPSGNCSTFNCVPPNQKERGNDCDDNNATITTTEYMKGAISKYEQTKEMSLTATKIENSKILINIISLLFYLFVIFAIVLVLSWFVVKRKFIMQKGSETYNNEPYKGNRYEQSSQSVQTEKITKRYDEMSKGTPKTEESNFCNKPKEEKCVEKEPKGIKKEDKSEERSGLGGAPHEEEKEDFIYGLKRKENKKDNKF